MAGDEKDGYYCSICGGIPPERVRTRLVTIDGREVGIEHLDLIFQEVHDLGLTDDAAISEEIMRRVREANYVPTKKVALYSAALLREYRQWEKEHT